jgi:mono/diheme cytochrome c family protein
MTMKKVVVLLVAFAFCLAVVPAFAAEDGKALYGSKCAMCHGKEGVAGKMAAGAKNFNDPAFKKAETGDSIVKIIHEGKGKMKGLGDKVNAEQAKAIADYVLTLAK